MNKAFEDCPKECPLENDSKWLTEKVSEIIKKLEAEKAKLNIQLEKVLEAIEAGIPCPNVVDLPVINDCDDKNCGKCWREALETVGKTS